MKGHFKAILILIFIANVSLISGILAKENAASEENLSTILDKVAARIKSYPQLNNWSASVVSTQMELDKNWKPKKITRVFKVVNVINNRRREEIKRAEEIEKGKVKDITPKYIREIEQRRQDQMKREAERKREGSISEDSRRSRRSFNFEDVFPFEEKSRSKYIFTRLEDEILDGQTVFVLQAQAKNRTEEIWEGKYFVSQDSFDVLKIVLNLAKNPKFVKELVAEIDFQTLPTGQFALKKVKMKVEGGIAIKSVRMIIEEEYSDLEVFEGQVEKEIF